MTHASRLEICELCVNKTFSPKSGIICSLTNERAAFEGSCEDFSEDPKMVVRKARLVESRKNLSNGGGGDLIGVEEDEKSSSPWKIVLTVIIVILFLIRMLARCDRIMN